MSSQRRSSSGDSSSYDDPSIDETGTPAIVKLFSDAGLYEEALAENGTGPYSVKNGNSSITGFADLIASDLDLSEKAITSRYAKLAVAKESWAPLTAEPDGYETDSDSDGEVFPPGEDKASQRFDKESPPQVHLLSRNSTTDDEGWKIESEDVIRLLVDEFGPLAQEEEEKLIIEADGALISDVSILGVIHLTTHRLTFHASLLSTRPDLSPDQQIIKAGPAIIHRKGWRRKRRVWLEISHDMMSTYASSRDEDHIRPLRTVLYSDIRQVLPLDRSNPRYLRVQFSASMPESTGIAEFDTEESANEWRRELQGAVYLYRHTRRHSLADTKSEDADGVRISIPLNRINSANGGRSHDFAYLFTVQVPLGPDEVPGLNLAKEDTTPSQLSLTKVQFVTFRPDVTWSHLQEYVTAAKSKQADEVSTVIIDFGPLSYVETATGGQDPRLSNPHDNTEAAIRSNLALDTEAEMWTTRARIYCGIISAGYFVVTSRFIGFWSKTFGHAAIRYRLPLSIVKQAITWSSKIPCHYGLVLELDGQADLRFAFKTAASRDEAINRINPAVKLHSSKTLGLVSSSPPTSPATWSRSDSNGSSPIGTRISSASGDETPDIPTPRTPTRSASGILSPLARTMATVLSKPVPEDIRQFWPKAINLPRDTLFMTIPKHFICLTIGSRGDVQPYIALGLGLQREGHKVTIVTHEEYRDWIIAFGIEHRTAGGDPGALMKLSVENKMFSPEFFKQSLSNFRPWLDQLLADAWKQCQDADVLLESPSAMAGVHIAEALNIPYFRCFTMPWTKSTDFPHAFLSPPVDAPTFNSASYVLFDNVIWAATSGQINRWRRNTLNIGPTDMGHLAQSKITFIYNFSPVVVPKPLDWTDTTIVSGYWFLDNPDPDWSPPHTLVEWMSMARKDRKPIVYIGFGSITVPDSRRVTESIVKAVLKSGVRAIISKGWSSRMSKSNDPEMEFPAECYSLDKVPHDWLFPQIDAACHHGGAGTTSASLRAGIPTLIKPWFGDQFFWASRVQKLGAGMKVTLKVNDLADALVKATTDRIMKEKAATVGEKIRAEDGVRTAISAIYTYLPRARRDRLTLE